MLAVPFPAGVPWAPDEHGQEFDDADGAALLAVNEMPGRLTRLGYGVAATWLSPAPSRMNTSAS